MKRDIEFSRRRKIKDEEYINPEGPTHPKLHPIMEKFLPHTLFFLIKIRIHHAIYNKHDIKLGLIKFSGRSIRFLLENDDSIEKFLFHEVRI